MNSTGSLDSFLNQVLFLVHEILGHVLFVIFSDSMFLMNIENKLAWQLLSFWTAATPQHG